MQYTVDCPCTHSGSKQEQSHCHLANVHGGGAPSVKNRKSSEKCSASQMVEPLDRDLGKPPTFGGHDADYQDLRFAFRIHMSLVSSVSQTLMDKCEAERNPISLTAARRIIFEMLHTDALLVCFNYERKCPNTCYFR